MGMCIYWVLDFDCKTFLRRPDNRDHLYIQVNLDMTDHCMTDFCI